MTKADFLAGMTKKLTKPERRVSDAFLSHVKISKRKTKKPIIVAMIGLVGSGKSFVARKLALMLGATVIECDRIRIGLRAAHLPYDHVSAIAEDAGRVVIGQGGNVVFDSDFASPEKQESLRKFARDIGASVFFIRVTCDLDIMLGRILAASDKKPDVFFRNASSLWKGPARQKAAVVKIREMLRRIPHHYRWSNRNGGAWKLKKLSPKPFAEIDTSDPELKKEVGHIAQQILQRRRDSTIV